jgi:ADP-ribose pyrophosphatase YjhB (NUDIX family)
MSNNIKPSYCYMCGVEIEYKQQLPTCRSHGILWPLIRNAAAAETITMNDRGEVLLAKRAIEPMIGSWALPGGFSDYGENPEETAIRETKEETGWEVKIERIFGVYLDSFPGDYHSEHRWVVSYLANPVKHTDVNNIEILKYDWFKLENLPENIMTEQLNRFYELAQLNAR